MIKIINVLVCVILVLSAKPESVPLVPKTMKSDQMVARYPGFTARSESLCSLFCNLNNRKGKHCLAMHYDPVTQSCEMGQMDMTLTTGEDIIVMLSPGKNPGHVCVFNWLEMTQAMRNR